MDWSKEPCIHLKSCHGKYLAAEANNTLNANRNHAAGWETFQIIHINNNNVGLQTQHGKYICCENNNNVVANRDNRGPWEVWAIEETKENGGGYGFRSHTGKYLSSNQNGNIWMADKLLPWETWKVDKSNNTLIGYKVYGKSPIYHTGIVLYGIEYCWWQNNKVHTGAINFPGGPFFKFRSSGLIKSNNKDEIMKKMNNIINDWNKGRFGKYNFIGNNCNDFSDYVLKQFDCPGIDEEYLQKNGLRKLANQFPGAKTLAALVNQRADQDMWDAACDEIGLNKQVKKGIEHAHKDVKRELQNLGKAFKW